MYSNVHAIWKHVVEDKAVFSWFGRYKPVDHERRFLQAFHSAGTLYFVADTLAQASGCPVSVSSAFIDKNPVFVWPAPSLPVQASVGSAAGRGEIADLLVVVKRTDSSGHSTSRGSLVQAKVTPSVNEYGKGKSSKQQVALYKSWPSVEFDTQPDRQALANAGLMTRYALNPSNGSPPFAFLRILKISPVVRPVVPGAPPASVWTHKSAANAEEPVAITDLPEGGRPVAWIDWLMDSHRVSDDFGDLDPPGSTPFTELVAALLVVLKKRQDRQLLGASGGELQREIVRPTVPTAPPPAFATFASLLADQEVDSRVSGGSRRQGKLTRFTPVDIAPGPLPRRLLALAGRMVRPIAHWITASPPPRPFVVLRVEFGSPERIEREPRAPDPSPSRPMYPGQSILDSISLRGEG